MEWAGQIDAHLNKADIILLLVSADFIASDYCYDKEMTRAMERHELGEARVIPVMLRTCDWDLAPFFKLQGLPTDMKPVTRWISQDEAFTDVAKGIRKVAEELRITPPKLVSGNSKPFESLSLPSKAHQSKSPRRDPYSLLLWGPRLEIEIGLPILGGGKKDFSQDSSDKSGFWRVPALIDTGAQRTVVTPAVIARLGLPRVDVIRLARAGGVDQDVNVYVAAIRLPRYKLANIEVVKVICCELPQQPIQGLLGRDILSRWSFTYDGPGGEWAIDENEEDIVGWSPP